MDWSEAYTLRSVVLYYFEWLLRIPFIVDISNSARLTLDAEVLSFYIDIYQEMQLLVIFYLVYPKTLGIQRLQESTRMACTE